MGLRRKSRHRNFIQSLLGLCLSRKRLRVIFPFHIQRHLIVQVIHVCWRNSIAIAENPVRHLRHCPATRLLFFTFASLSFATRRRRGATATRLKCRFRWRFLFTVRHHFFLFAVFAAFLNCALVGAPLDPGFRIFSPEPAAMRLRLAWMFAYSPGFFAITILPLRPSRPRSFCP